MEKIILLSCLCIFAGLNAFAQKTFELHLNHLLGTEPFTNTTIASNDVGSSFNVTRLQYYISNISLVHSGGQVTPCTGVYILADANMQGKFMLGSYDVTDLEAINFSIGVNTPENNADPAQWPEEHALAPKSPAMHWGWAAGYRFVAMEGKAGSKLDQTYEIHALGNDNYFQVQIPTSSTTENGNEIITLNADYAMALKGLNVNGGLINHGETGEAVTLLQNFANNVFTSLSGEGNALGIKDLAWQNAFEIYPNPSNGVVNLSLIDNDLNNIEIVVTDVLGKETARMPWDFAGTPLSISEKGVFIISIYKNGELLAFEKLMVQ